MTDAHDPAPESAPASAPESGPVVVHVPARHRYEIRVPGDGDGDAGGELGGYVTYRRIDGRFVFDHTVIEPAFEGRGLGSRLARAALDDVRAQGEQVVPLCPFIAGWISKHPEYDAAVDHELFDRLRESG